MRETEDDLRWLQSELDRSVEQAGPFLREAFEMPDKSLSASELTRLLRGVPTVALATVTADGEPRVAPTGAIFYRGHFCIPTVAKAAKVRMVQRAAAASLSYYRGNDLAVIVHGRAEILGPDSAEFVPLLHVQQEVTGSSVQDWGEGLFLRLIPDRIFTYARSKAALQQQIEQTEAR